MIWYVFTTKMTLILIKMHKIPEIYIIAVQL